MTDKQRVSNWLPTGSHTFCPACGSPDVMVAYHVYEDKDAGWEYLCPACGGYGVGTMKGVDTGEDQASC